MMRFPWQSLPAIVVLCVGTARADTAQLDAQVSLGDSTQRVEAIMGAPDGVFQKGQQETYIYDRGLVDFVDGVVIRADLLTEAELKAREAEKANEEAERQRRQDFARRRAMEQGLAEKTLKLQDERFLKSPAADRYAYWRAFSRRYPAVSVSAELDASHKEMQEQQQAGAAEGHKAGLQTRVREIASRLKELDAAYAASLAHWKRNEINTERANLARELADIALQLIDTQGNGQGGGT